jgi:hypothetical protein
MTDSGIAVAVADGLATIDFIDPALRGPALARLVDIGGQLSIETLTRRGPRRLYRVPEGNPREAGLLDDSTAADAHATGDSGFAAALADAGHAARQPDTLQRSSRPAAAIPTASPTTTGAGPNSTPTPRRSRASTPPICRPRRRCSPRSLKETTDDDQDSPPADMGDPQPTRTDGPAHRRA